MARDRRPRRARLHEHHARHAARDRLSQEGPSAEVEIRRLDERDLEPLNRLMPSWNSGEYAKRLRAQGRGEMVQVVAWDGEVPVGRGMVLFPTHGEWSVSALRERCAEVRDVLVLPSHRRIGVARAMMRELEDAARGARLDRIGLSVAQDLEAAPARALYGALDYTHAHGPYISSGRLDGDDASIPVGAVLSYLAKSLV